MEAQALQRYQTVAASNPNTPISYLRQFSKSENETTIFWVGENPSLPKDVIQVFVDNLISSDEHERCHLWGQIANNTSLGEDTIALLSKHKLYWVREKIARNKSTPQVIGSGKCTVIIDSWVSKLGGRKEIESVAGKGYTLRVFFSTLENK